MLSSGRSDCVVAATSSTVRVSGQETKTYTFDAVADKDATQTDIYKGEFAQHNQLVGLKASVCKFNGCLCLHVRFCSRRQADGR